MIRQGLTAWAAAAIFVFVGCEPNEGPDEMAGAQSEAGKSTSTGSGGRPDTPTAGTPSTGGAGTAAGESGTGGVGGAAGQSMMIVGGMSTPGGQSHIFLAYMVVNISKS